MTWWASDHTHVAGFKVAIPEGRDVTEALSSLEAGLALIDSHAPWILANARRARVRILLRLRGSPRVAHGDIHVGSSWLLEMPPPYVASSLVERFAVARVRRIVPPWRGDAGLRVTRLVLEQRIAFCNRLPDAAFMVQQLRDGWDAGYYNADQVSESQNRRTDDLMAELQDLGMPSWMRRLFGRLASWSVRK